jgi:hypothetical protein
MNMSRKQILWLRTRGGRTPNEVLEVEGKFYYFSNSRGAEIALEVPDDKKIEIWLEDQRWVHCGSIVTRK